MRKVRGFTLIELLVVMVIIGILVAIALPNYMKAKDRARETQVQSNIHVIQMAVERYAVDNNGEYPKWLLGGDWSDWDTVQFFSPVYCPGMATKPCGDGDVLLEYGYLSQYPANPFMKNANTGRNLQVLDCPSPRTYSDGTSPSGVNFCDYGQGQNGPGYLGTTCNSNGAGGYPSCRKVGGISNNLMWDVSEGIYGAAGAQANENRYAGRFPTRGTSVMAVRGWAGHPPWPILCNRGAAGCDQASSASPTRRISPWLVGNFYYYPITANMNMVFISVPHEPMVGYYLAGYGAIWDTGHDVYDVFGDYYESSIFCDIDPLGNCRADTSDTPYRQNNPNYKKMYCVSNGPDGQRDGVIVVVASGRDTKAPMDKAPPGCG